MPSGSHYSGGSHFGGGSFGGSHHSSGGHSAVGHTPYVRTGPRIVFFGGHHVYFSPARNNWISAFIGLMVCALVAAVLGGVVWATSASELREIEQDYLHYQALVQRAQADPSLVWQAKVVDAFRYEDSDCYYLEYRFVAHLDQDESSDAYLKDTRQQVIKGNTYYVYTRDEALTMKGKIFAVALDMATITDETDSTLMDPVSLAKTLTDDAEYRASQTARTVGRVLVVAAIGVAIITAVGLIIAYTTAKQATPEQVAAGQAKAAAATNTWKCSYCGAVNDQQQTTCTACGARRAQ